MSRTLSSARRGTRLKYGAAILIGLMGCSSVSDSVSGPDVAPAADSRFSFLNNVASVSVTPKAPTMNVGQALNLVAAALNAFGTSVTGNLVSWKSSDATTVSVSTAGVATAIRAGTATISATVAGVTGSTTITVANGTPGTVSTLAVVSTTDTSATLTFTQVSDGTGSPASYGVGYAVSPLISSAPISVLNGTCKTPVAGTKVGAQLTCTVTGLAASTTYQFEVVALRGTINVNAVIGAISNVVTAKTAAAAATAAPVAPAPVAASVAVSPATASSTVGTKLALSATVRDKNNNIMTGQHVTWSSGNTAIATVDTTGTTTGISAGTATITATVAGIAGTAQVTETAAVQTPPPSQPSSAQSGTYPNEPAGLTRFAELDFSGLPGVAGTKGTLAGNWWSYQKSGASHLTIGSDATQTVPSLMQIDFETGTQPGYDDADQSIRAFGGWTTANESNNTTYSEIYESTRFKIPTANFETQEAGVKLLGYWGVGANNTNTAALQIFSWMEGAGGSTSVMSSWKLDMAQQNIVSTLLPQNLNLGTKVTAGVWHQFETHMKVNDIGVANGVWEWWLDGVKIGYYTNVTFRTAQYPSGFWGRRFDPVWGGGGGAAKSRTDNLWLDHMYLSGKP